MKPAIMMEGIKKRYGKGATAVDALRGVNMAVFPGEVIGLIGPSGSGKTTLLQCLGAIIDPTAGRIELGDEAIYDGGWLIKDVRALRRDKIGFMFQAPHLIPFMTNIENVAMPMLLAGRPYEEARYRAMELLTTLDIADKAEFKSYQLSGGQAQRVSIARALANNPPVILADEPTAPLDSRRSLSVIKLLNDLAKQYGTAIIVVTHDEVIVPTFKRIYRVREGLVFEEHGEGKELSLG
ncbi:ABC-type antimicrobial peptide transport system, ATPase component MacB (plasmid) [Peptoclostridium acidaminophilum DSM 3953]|uniref:ABC-type antimicrobial peptide transport system, ATPase component MacB n=1 Tax=Peptoclostridium acidaminophilum DSM 3953 TaxID=1286171 RepID=W8TA44_PEPAC|nr:ABC transporter ATP-binding protein [Peptoclostridium acidaminophilum]AHM57765.1 ABC-type antimicrobial peptide transport system, ATPase component MacB [Peptoclostridium acidaminophilum DSM 3953]